DPDVDVRLPFAAVEREHAARHDLLDTQSPGVAGAGVDLVHRVTTDRSTEPDFMESNAASTESSEMRSVTNLSNGRRPCWCRSMSIVTPLSVRQPPYQEDLGAPPRPKKSSFGRSRCISGVGTPTRTPRPARSRA